jgi:hypothetical protein
MAFWNQGVIEPKRNFRWVASIPGMESDVKFLLKKFKKPTFEIKATEHMYLNHKFNFPGRLTWKESSFTLVNVADQSTGQGFKFDTVKVFMEKVVKAGYQNPSLQTGNVAIKTISKNSLVNALGKLSVSQLAPEGSEQAVQEKWEFYNPIITSIDMPELDYGNEDLSELTVNFVYDYAVLVGAVTQ